MKLFTIGFTKTSAEYFFGRLSEAGVERLLDVRLSNESQLAGFAKKEDLRFFAKSVAGVEYRHLPEMAPTKEIFQSVKKHKGRWQDFESQFLELMAARKIEEVDRDLLDEGCLLCSEDKPDRCHRRLVAEYLQRKWEEIEICHL